jgi:hypothetical protein
MYGGSIETGFQAAAFNRTRHIDEKQSRSQLEHSAADSKVRASWFARLLGALTSRRPVFAQVETCG